MDKRIAEVTKAALDSSLQEWQNASASEMDSAEVAKVQKKLEGARVRLARETNNGPRK